MCPANTLADGDGEVAPANVDSHLGDPVVATPFEVWMLLCFHSAALDFLVICFSDFLNYQCVHVGIKCVHFGMQCVHVILFVMI